SVGPVPFTLALNPVTHTVYVTDLGAETVSVIDGSSCNATKVGGCRRRPVTVNVGETPGGIALDARTNTIYVTGESTSDVAVIDGKPCNARVKSSCRRPHLQRPRAQELLTREGPRPTRPFPTRAYCPASYASAATGSGRTSTVSTTWMISSAGRSASEACLRRASGLVAS